MQLTQKWIVGSSLVLWSYMYADFWQVFWYKIWWFFLHRLAMSKQLLIANFFFWAQKQVAWSSMALDVYADKCILMSAKSSGTRLGCCLVCNVQLAIAFQKGS